MKTYEETLAYLSEKGHTFSDMKTMVRFVAFVYFSDVDKVDYESLIRKDIWEYRKRHAPENYPMASDTKKEPG